MAEPTIYGIADITRRIASLLRGESDLQNVWIAGEVSQCIQPRSGHLYFTLKDDRAQLSCVMWARTAGRHRWLPEPGDQIQALGKVDVYEVRGQYQFIASRLIPAGRGSLFAQFERLKARFEQEGLFSPDRKRPLPAYPQHIGIVTSLEADALRDVLRTLQHRWPVVEVVLFPSLVQGNEAPPALVRALQTAAAYHASRQPLDAVLLVRGGGSAEDLWAFNDEGVVYAVAHHDVPIVTGVGHETDFALVDFVSDVRASTPTGAAMAVAPDRAELIQALTQVRGRLQRRMEGAAHLRRARLEQLAIRLRNAHPMQVLRQRAQDLDYLTARLERAKVLAEERRQAELAAVTARLTSLNPFAVLERGYSLVRAANGQIVTQPEQVSYGERLQVQNQGGVFAVTRVEEDMFDAPAGAEGPARP